MNIHSYLKAFHYFSIAARYLSIKQASEHLHVTQAAISQQIRLLEEALGVSLFHRQHRALALTTEGASLLPHLEAGFDAIERGVDSLSLDKDPNTITLSVLPSFASRWLIPRLGGFYEENPSIAINLSMTDKLETFGAQGVDMAIRFGGGDYEGVESRYLMKDYIYPVCHSAYLKKKLIKKWDDLKNLRLLDDTASDLAWDYWLQKKGLEKGKDSLNRVRYDGSHYVIDSALSAQGVAMVRHSLVAEAIEQSQLTRLSDEPLELEHQYFLCALPHYYDYPKIKRFVVWLTQQVELFSERYSI